MDQRFPAAAADNADLGLGSTVAQVTASYIRLGDELDAKPAPVPGTSESITGTDLRMVTYELLLHNTTLTALAGFWKATADLEAGKTPTAADQTVLQQVLASTPAQPGVPADNQITMTWALFCGDAAWSRSVNSYAAATAAARAEHPLADGMPDEITPCAFWSKASAEPAVTVTSAGPRDILILQNKRDNATPYAGALGMYKALGSRAGFVSVDNGGHYVYDVGSTCADQAANVFLTKGSISFPSASARSVVPAGEPRLTPGATVVHAERGEQRDVRAESRLTARTGQDLPGGLPSYANSRSTPTSAATVGRCCAEVIRDHFLAGRELSPPELLELADRAEREGELPKQCARRFLELAVVRLSSRPSRSTEPGIRLLRRSPPSPPTSAGCAARTSTTSPRTRHRRALPAHERAGHRDDRRHPGAAALEGPGRAAPEPSVRSLSRAPVFHDSQRRYRPRRLRRALYPRRPGSGRRGPQRDRRTAPQRGVIAAEHPP